MRITMSYKAPDRGREYSMGMYRVVSATNNIDVRALVTHEGVYFGPPLASLFTYIVIINEYIDDIKPTAVGESGGHLA